MQTLVDTAMQIADYMAWGGFVYTGGMWMMDQRTAAIQRLMNICFGYLIIRHAWDILRFLKGL